MKLEFLKLMKCPYCGSDLNLGKIYQEDNGNITNGYITCECNEYPIIEGILILKIGPLSEILIKFLKDGKTAEAIEYSIYHFGERVFEARNFLKYKGFLGQAFGDVLSSLMGIRAKGLYRKYSDEKLPFSSLLSKSEFGIYLKNRFSAETFWSLYPFIHLLRENRERILDLSCGTGHSSFVLSNYVKPSQLVCADYNFRHLYLTKKYFAKDATFICLDANYSLPFKDGIFSTLLMMDAFHYIRGQSSLAGEMERVISSQGLLLLLHLHNSENYNPAAGRPLSPTGWRNLFQNIPTKLVPENNVIEDFIFEDKLDLAREYSEPNLDSSNALIVIGTRDKSSVLRTYQSVWKPLLDNKSNLIINPIYMIEYQTNRVILRRKFSSESFRREYPITEKYLPEECITDERIAKALNGKTIVTSSTELLEQDLNHIEDMMRKFIIINVPQNY